MATDATGTPTAKGIPTYNPDVDAPSGLGFNAAMQAIDQLLNNYAGNISGIAVGEAAVWNGSAWVRSTTQLIGATSLGSGTPDAGKFLRGDGAWAGTASYGTALPGSPVDGQEHILVDSTTAPTYSWRFRYVAAKFTNKWVFIGGAPGYHEIDTAESTNSGTFAALVTDGPTFAVPVAGDYIVEIGAEAYVTAGAAVSIFMSFAIGGALAQNTEQLVFTIAGNSHINSGQRSNKLDLSAVTLTAKYRTDSAVTGSWQKRWMRVTPIAVGG